MFSPSPPAIPVAVAVATAFAFELPPPMSWMVFPEAFDVDVAVSVIAPSLRMVSASFPPASPVASEVAVDPASALTPPTMLMLTEPIWAVEVAVPVMLLPAVVTIVFSPSPPLAPTDSACAFVWPLADAPPIRLTDTERPVALASLTALSVFSFLSQSPSAPPSMPIADALATMLTSAAP